MTEEHPDHDDELWGDTYEVYKDGEPVEGCFVLRPKQDETARRALEMYIKYTDDTELEESLRRWLFTIEITEFFEAEELRRGS